MQSSPSTTNYAAQYDPWRLELTRGITAYSDFHEWAHLDQHATQTLAWRMRDRCRTIPVAGRLANVLVECEAALMAWRDMRACGCWQGADAIEAIQGLLCYLLTMTVFYE